jgi:hypothetical protein
MDQKYLESYEMLYLEKKDGEDQLDRSCERRKHLTDNKKKEE